MLFLENGFRTFTGGLLEKLLAKTTDSLTKSITFGVVTTTVMQSSSLVSVITISFLSAGLIGLAAGIGIIFGANLGGNITPIGSASTLVAVAIIHKAKPPLSFGAFVKMALPFALGQLVLAAIYVLVFLR